MGSNKLRDNRDKLHVAWIFRTYQLVSADKNQTRLLVCIEFTLTTIDFGIAFT